MFVYILIIQAIYLQYQCFVSGIRHIQWSRGESTFIYPIKYTSWVVCNANFETYDLANDVDGYTQSGFIINSNRLVQCDFGSWFESVIFDMFITIGY